jgi:hypothetical protein
MEREIHTVVIETPAPVTPSSSLCTAVLHFTPSRLILHLTRDFTSEPSLQVRKLTAHDISHEAGCHAMR